MGLIVLDHDELARRMRSLRDGGKRIVLTNGCFDLLHVGHLRCLSDAATRGDFLVVAINSDASVRRLKGADRPVQPAAERAEILSAITGVSYVTVFDEPTVGPLLRKLRPQIVAKGTDYDADNLPEREVVAEIGAELAIVGDPKRHSTIRLLERIRSGRGVAVAREKRPAKGTPKRAGGRAGATRGATRSGGKKTKAASRGSAPSGARAMVARAIAARSAGARKRSSASEAHA